MTTTARATFLNGGDSLSEYGEGHREAAELIREALVKHGFLTAGLNDAVWLWGEYSDSWAAGWIGGAEPEDVQYHESRDEHLDEIFSCVECYIRKSVRPDPK